MSTNVQKFFSSHPFANSQGNLYLEEMQVLRAPVSPYQDFFSLYKQELQPPNDGNFFKDPDWFSLLIAGHHGMWQTFAGVSDFLETIRQHSSKEKLELICQFVSWQGLGVVSLLKEEENFLTYQVQHSLEKDSGNSLQSAFWAGVILSLHLLAFLPQEKTDSIFSSNFLKSKDESILNKILEEHENSVQQILGSKNSAQFRVQKIGHK